MLCCVVNYLVDLQSKKGYGLLKMEKGAHQLNCQKAPADHAARDFGVWNISPSGR